MFGKGCLMQEKKKPGFTKEELQKIIKGASELRDKREQKQRASYLNGRVWIRRPSFLY